MENQFKPFQPVLVRNSDNAHWKTALYSNYNAEQDKHYADNKPWNQIVSYGELTEPLIGTTKSALEIFVNMALPKAEDMEALLEELITKCDEDTKKTALEDPLHKMEKDIYMKLQEDAFDCGLTSEVSEMILENPGVNMVTLDKWIRNEYDI